MSKWSLVRIDEICEVNPKIGRGVLSPDTLVSFLPMAAVEENGGGIINVSERAYHEVSKGYTYFQDNDVIFAKITPCMENGKVVIAKNLKNGIGFGSTEFHVLRCSSKVLPKWVFAFLIQPSYREQARRNFTGTAGQQRVPTDFIKNTIIPLPPLPEQERIVRLLDEAEALRTQRDQANERMEDFVPALFEEMFGDPGTNPKKWEVVEVRSLLKLCEYGTSQKANEEGIGLPVLRMGNVTFVGALDLTSLKHVKLSDNEAKKQLLETGDVLFNRTNSRELVGKTGMWDGRFPAYAASYFIRMRFDSEKEHPQHFTTFMNLPYMKKKLVDLARGAVGQANINAQELQSIKMPVPPLALQQEFAERVKEAREIQSAQGRSTERVEALYQSMLDRAFKGEL